MFNEHYEQKKYYEWLDNEQKKRNPAATLKLQKCVRCGFCCACRTCVPTPAEIPIIAKYLNLKIKDFMKQYMVIDKFKNIPFLRFANTKQKNILGKKLSAIRTYDKGQCLLYDEFKKICVIHKVKPKDAKNASCWKQGSIYNAYFAIQQWKDDNLKKLRKQNG